MRSERLCTRTSSSAHTSLSRIRGRKRTRTCIPSYLHGHSALSSASSRHLRRTISWRRTTRSVFEELSELTEGPDDYPHDDDGARSALLRSPASGSHPTHPRRDHRHRSRGPSLDRPWVAPPTPEGRGEPCDGPAGRGTPARSPRTPKTREKAHRAPSAGARSPAKLRIHVDAPASARRTRQDQDPARRGSGPRVCALAGAAAIPALVAESVPCLATAAGRVGACRSVVLSAHVAPID